MPISFDSERNRRKKRTKRGKGQQNVASFPLLELPHPMAESVGDYYLTYHFFVLLNRFFFLALLSM